MIKAIELPLRNLKRNKKRNLATGLAVAFGFAGALLLGGYVYRVINYLRVYSIYATRTGHIVLFHKDGLDKYPLKPRHFSITPAEQRQIDAILKDMPDVEFFGRELTGTGLIGNGCATVPFLAKGIEPEIDRRLLEHPEMKRWAPNLTHFLKGDGLWNYPAELGAIALSKGLAKRLSKPKVHGEIPASQPLHVMQDCQSGNSRSEIALDANVQLAAGSWSGSLSALDGEVVAHFTTGFVESDASAMLTSLTRLQQLYDTQNIARYSIWLKDPGRLGQTLAALRARLTRNGVDADLYPWNINSIAPLYVGTVQFLFTLSVFILSVLSSVVVLSIFNSVTITVIERSQEIGTLRALGYRRAEIQRIFVGEAVFLALIALVFGGVVALAAMFGINSANIQFHPPGTAGGMQLLLIPNAPIAAVIASVILGLTVLATLIAARNVAGKTIPALLAGSNR